MSGVRLIRLQVCLVAALFLASLAAVSFSAVRAVYLGRDERAVRDRLLAAADELAVAAEQPLGTATGVDLASLNAELRQSAGGVLRQFPDVEGGYYLRDADRFAGLGKPADGPPGPPAPAGNPPPPPHGGLADDPPPREAPFILVQAKQSLTLAAGEHQFDERAVGPSRVAILTRPVGAARPAVAATWVMYRVTRPEDAATQLARYEWSTGLALGGIALAAVLAANLGRLVRAQRQDQDHLREELRRSEHLAGLGKLLAGVAHEVRNPLAGIRSTVQLWERLPETARTPASIAAVVRAVDRLNDIVTRLLHFSRADGAERRPVEVNGLVRETLELLRAQAAGQTVSIELDLAVDLPPVDGAADALRQVFLNLAANALQAMPAGGSLRCSTRFDRAAGLVEVRVADTGRGVSAEDRSHLFEPFFTTRPEGTGLGLALCREIVAQHGGRVELEPAAGVGSTFCVTLPARSASVGGPV